MKTLEDLFQHFLRDLHYAERQVLKTLPKLAANADSPALQRTFKDHEVAAERAIANLEAVFRSLGLKPRTEHCEAIVGIIDEGRDIMAEAAGADALDAGLVASVRAALHYAMTRYDTLTTWAGRLGYLDAVPLLEANLDAHRAADRMLALIGEDRLNGMDLNGEDPEAPALRPVRRAESSEMSRSAAFR